MNDLTKIAGTLKYGAFDGRKRKKLLIPCATFTAVMILCVAGAITALWIDQANDQTPLPDIEFAFANIGIAIGLLLVPAVLWGLFIHNEKIRNKILLWLQDAVELEGHCETLSEDYTSAPLNQLISSPSRIRIRIKFKYNGKHYSRDSGYRNKNGELKNEYQAIWIHYADKSVKIMYSPEFDEVIILKDQSVNSHYNIF